MPAGKSDIFSWLRVFLRGAREEADGRCGVFDGEMHGEAGQKTSRSASLKDAIESHFFETFKDKKPSPQRGLLYPFNQPEAMRSPCVAFGPGGSVSQFRLPRPRCRKRRVRMVAEALSAQTARALRIAA
jgi:hypothetical protein